MLGDLDNGDDIASSVERLLRIADVNERLPTPVADIVSAAGLVKTDQVLLSDSMIAKAPKHLRKLLRSAARKVVGVLDRRERVIQIDPSSSTGRENFVTCHEVAHDIFPWQRDLQVLGDTSQTLTATVTNRFEREANQGGAEILFQLDLFRRVAGDFPIDLATPVELSAMFGASIHASFRRWVEGLDVPACGLVMDPALDVGGRRRRHEHIDSGPWRRQFGRRRLPIRIGVDDHAFAGADNGSGDMLLTDLARDPVALRWQTLSTPYRTFALLWVPTKSSFVARHRRRATLLIPGS
ncbi:MAG: ImmA/IrrE family metallo-endopeptidase [Actinomycetota bacterium]